jgi:hypothetical protein
MTLLARHWEKVGVELHPTRNLALEEGGWSTPSSGCLIPGEGPGNYCTGARSASGPGWRAWQVFPRSGILLLRGLNSVLKLSAVIMVWVAEGCGYKADVGIGCCGY